MIQQPKERRASTIQGPISLSSENEHATASNDSSADSIWLCPVLLIKMAHEEVVTQINRGEECTERKTSVQDSNFISKLFILCTCKPLAHFV